MICVTMHDAMGINRCTLIGKVESCYNQKPTFISGVNGVGERLICTNLKPPIIMNTEVTKYIENSSEDQVEILKELRNLIFSIVPNVNEQFKWSRPVYALDQDFCYIKTTKKHVTFGFFEFDKIKTNKDLLEGTGKQMRHIKINSVSQIAEYKIHKMIKEVLK